jgi:hypothetical protein
MSTTRETLDDPPRPRCASTSCGGGFVGIRNAFGTEYNREWYECLLDGANYFDHGRIQPGTVVTTSRRDASTAGLPARWQFTDEWYNLVPFPSRVRILASVDGFLRHVFGGIESAMGRSPFCR